jgi:hypothetical protein
MFLSIDGIKCDIPMFRGKTGLSRDVPLLLLEGYLWKVLWGFLCSGILPLPPGNLVVSVGNSVAELGN